MNRRVARLLVSVLLVSVLLVSVLLVSVLLVVVLGALGTGTAVAHVDADPTAEAAATDDAGITTVVLVFDHGCAGSPTTGLRVRLPDGTTDVETENPEGWMSAIEDDVISWSGGSIPDDAEGRFSFRARLVGPEGSVVYLPTVQLCAAGQEDWIEVPDPARPDAELPAPAPAVVLSRTVEASSGDKPSSEVGTRPTATVGTSDSTVATGGATPTTESRTGAAAGAEPGTTGLVVLGIVLVIIAAGVAVLYLRHRPRRGSGSDD